MKKIIFLFCQLFVSCVSGQQLQQSSLYMFNVLYYNPAYAGTRNSLSTTFLQRSQWIGFDGAPSTQFFSIHSPLAKDKVGLGLHVNNDRIGSRKTLSAGIDVAGSILVNRKGDKLNVGISLGFDNYHLNFSDLYSYDVNDQIAASNYSFFRPNVGLGFYYRSKNYRVGFSVPKIIENSIAGTTVQNRDFILTGSYVKKINNTLDFKPSLLVKGVAGAPLSFDLSSLFFIKKMFWAGAMYRLNEGIGVNFAYLFNNSLLMSYSYDFPINRLVTRQSGSHEIMLMYDLKSKGSKTQIHSPRYF